jgi:hypothetical protein
MIATTTVPSTGDPGIERTARHLRAVAAIALALVALVALASCTPSVGKIETNTAAASARRVGYAGATSTQMSCTGVSSSTSGTKTIVKADCRNTTTVCCAIPVTTTYNGSSASATASFDAQWLNDPWFRESGRMTVTCQWTKSGDTWTLGSCGAPKEVAA